MSEDSENDIDLELDMNPKQVQFCREYIIDMNATQAYIRAGYAEHSAGQNAAILMKKHKIQALIKKFARDRALRTQTEADQIVSQLARIGMSDIRKIFTANGQLKRVEDLDADTAASIQSVKVTQRPTVDYDGEKTYEDVVEYKLADKRGALELLGKHISLWEGSSNGAETVADALRDLAEKLPS